MNQDSGNAARRQVVVIDLDKNGNSIRHEVAVPPGLDHLTTRQWDRLIEIQQVQIEILQEARRR